MIKYLNAIALFLLISSCSSPTKSDDFEPIEIMPYDGDTSYPTTFPVLTEEQISERRNHFLELTDGSINFNIDSLGFLTLNFDSDPAREKSRMRLKNIDRMITRIKYELVRLYEFTGITDTAELSDASFGYNFGYNFPQVSNDPSTVAFTFGKQWFEGHRLYRYISVWADIFGIYTLHVNWYRYIALPPGIPVSGEEAKNQFIGQEFSYREFIPELNYTLTEDHLVVAAEKIIYPYYTRNGLELRLCHVITVLDTDKIDPIWEYYVDTQTGEVLGEDNLIVIAIEESIL